MSSKIVPFPGRKASARPAAPRTALFRSIVTFSPAGHAALAVLALASAPVLYLTLELPKWVVNGALGHAAEGMPAFLAAMEAEAALPILCGAQLAFLAILSAMKFAGNLASANLGERFLRRERMRILRRWHALPAEARDQGVAPVLTQELEAIAGFAGGAVSIPVAQGAAFVTVMAFLVMQDWRLALAAIALTPVQAVLVPLLLRRIGALKKERIAVMRGMCARLGDEDAVSLAAALLDTRRAQDLRFEIHRRKFAMKAIYNMIGHLTPLAYLSIGGWLVLAGDLSLGALVAALAAYREGAGPMREMFAYYMRWADTRTRHLAMADLAMADLAMANLGGETPRITAPAARAAA